jgi:ribose 1,5-bisphosphokinase PhnN
MSSSQHALYGFPEAVREWLTHGTVPTDNRLPQGPEQETQYSNRQQTNFSTTMPVLRQQIVKAATAEYIFNGHTGNAMVMEG